MGRKILLGVTGSIAAYKAVELLRLFVKNGDEVKVVMTKSATEFVQPLTFRTLSRNQVAVDEFAPVTQWNVEHVDLALWADAVVIAPATANTIAKIRYGLADNLLSSILLATKAPIVIAPAMNTAMLENPATQENIAVLKSRNVKFVESVDGSLACGVNGNGCLADVVTIFKSV